MGLQQSLGLGLLWFLVLQAGLLHCITAQTEFVFVVEEVNIERMCLEQPLLTVNGTFPGPNITVTRGETVNVKVLNNGIYPITIHWHGLKQHRNPWSDGPEHITQSPIAAGGSFKYTLVFTDEEGTLWWHAHSDWSRASVHGAIIVLPRPNRPRTNQYPFQPQPDYTQTIILGSWFYNISVMDEYQKILASGGDAPGATSFTINGYPGQLETVCDDATVDMYTLPVESGKNYHLRIINAVMEEEMFFAIAGHTFMVVGLDGAYLNPVPSNYIMITPGQTMDILLTTNQNSSKAYYIGAKDFLDTSLSRARNMTTRAILRYPSYTGAEPPVDLGDLLPVDSKNASYAKAFTERVRVSGLTGNPDFPMNVPSDSDINQNFTITISVNTLPCPYAENNCSGPQYNSSWSGVHAGSLNNQRFVTQDVSILQAYRCNIAGVYEEDFPAAPEDFDYTGDVGNFENVPIPGTKVMTVNYGDAVQIVFQGTNVGNAENHPMHIHGYNFYLVGSDDGNFNESNSPATFNLTSPAEANTFGVPKNGWLAVRFWAKNPGVWFLHCHLERHATWGMAGVLIVKNTTTDADQSLLPPPADYPPCPSS